MSEEESPFTKDSYAGRGAALQDELDLLIERAGSNELRGLMKEIRDDLLGLASAAVTPNGLGGGDAHLRNGRGK